MAPQRKHKKIINEIIDANSFFKGYKHRRHHKNKKKNNDKRIKIENVKKREYLKEKNHGFEN